MLPARAGACGAPRGAQGRRLGLADDGSQGAGRHRPGLHRGGRGHGRPDLSGRCRRRLRGHRTAIFPFAIALGLGLCGIGLILEALTGGYRNLEGAPEGVKLDRAAWEGLGWIVGGLVFQLLTIPTIGFVPTSAVLFTCVARAFGARSLWRSAVIGLLMALAIWAIFTQLLGVSLQGFLRS